MVVKLNGGLGTGMGLEKAKSLLPVTGGLSFLDLIAQQVKDIDLVVPKGLDFGGHPQKGSILPQNLHTHPKGFLLALVPFARFGLKGHQQEQLPFVGSVFILSSYMPRI